MSYSSTNGRVKVNQITEITGALIRLPVTERFFNVRNSQEKSARDFANSLISSEHIFSREEALQPSCATLVKLLKTIKTCSIQAAERYEKHLVAEGFEPERLQFTPFLAIDGEWLELGVAQGDINLRNLGFSKLQRQQVKAAGMEDRGTIAAERKILIQLVTLGQSELSNSAETLIGQKATAKAQEEAKEIHRAKVAQTSEEWSEACDRNDRKNAKKLAASNSSNQFSAPDVENSSSSSSINISSNLSGTKRLFVDLSNGDVNEESTSGSEEETVQRKSKVNKNELYARREQQQALKTKEAQSDLDAAIAASLKLSDPVEIAKENEERRAEQKAAINEAVAEGVAKGMAEMMKLFSSNNNPG